MLKAEKPVNDSTIISTQCRRMVGQSRNRGSAANGSRIRKAPVQRMKASVIGGMWPAMKRPSTVLPAQNSEVSDSRR